jgi:DNA-binding LacI/PurR family transcriptional regulator
MPVVLIDRKVPGLDLDIVSVDNRTAMYNATKHLIDLGHRNIVHAVYNESPSAVQDRLSGYYSAMWDAFGNDAYGIVLISPGTPESPWPLLDAMLSLPVELRPTAIACVNDYLAYTVAERLLARQMSIPQDISVTGFDDILSMLPNGVGLTTMAQPFEEIGQKAAELLLSRLQSPILPCRDIVLPAAITIRGSTAPPPT